MWPFSLFKKKKNRKKLSEALKRRARVNNQGSIAAGINQQSPEVNKSRTVSIDVGVPSYGRDYYDDGPDVVDAALVGAMLMNDGDTQPRRYTDEAPVVNNYTPAPDAVKPEPIETYTSSSHDSGYSSSDNDSSGSCGFCGSDD